MSTPVVSTVGGFDASQPTMPPMLGHFEQANLYQDRPAGVCAAAYIDGGGAPLPGRPVYPQCWRLHRCHVTAEMLLTVR
jgi:hypothetical protein